MLSVEELTIQLTVDTISAKLSQGLIELLLDLLAGMGLCLRGIPLGGDGQAALLPARIFRPSFAFAADIHSGRVDFVVSLGLEVV